MTKRPLTLLLLLLLALPLTLALTSPAQATPLDELSAPSARFPADTLAFGVIRTDDAYLDQLDTLLDAVGNRLPGLIPPGISTRTLFSLLSGADFDTTIRAWLGDFIAVGLPADAITADTVSIPTFPALLVIDITDRDAAEAFIDEMRMVPTDTRTESDDYVLIVSDQGEALLIADDVLIFGASEAAVTAAYEMPEDSLAESDLFTAALAALPEDDYNALVYLDAQALTQSSLALLDEQMAAFQTPNFSAAELSILSSLEQSAAIIGQVAAGLTILEDRNLVLDVVNTLDEATAAARDAQPGMIAQTPINPDFAANIPADAQFVIHDNGFGPEFLAAFESLDALGPLLQAQIDTILALTLIEGTEVPPEIDLLSRLDLGAVSLGGLTRANLSVLFAGLTGLNLEDDVLSWMTGDYASYLRLLTVDEPLSVTLDAGLLFEATDPDAASAVLTQLETAANAYQLGSAKEEIGEGSALVLEAPLRVLLQGIVPPDAILAEELNLLIGTNEEVFALGSRPAVEDALLPQGDRLLDSPVYQYAAETLLLPDPFIVYFINVPPLTEALPALSVLVPENDLRQIGFFLGVLESATISARMSDDNAITARLTLTIEDEPAEPLPMPTASVPMMVPTSTSVAPNTPAPTPEAPAATEAVRPTATR
ncbi:MAG: DUF3352 domain-containing protein [bacterium]|nr:DUF3352 domain-containing protein [bacterium]